MEKIINANPRYQNQQKDGKKPLDIVVKTLIVKTLFFIKDSWSLLYYNYFTGDKNFTFENKKLKYFTARYNTTWSNERRVEVAIAADYLKEFANKRILEVGNVMSHYLDVKYDIVDKFEKAANVINEDILTYSPAEKYDLIISISTIEHVGWDDTEQDPQKIINVLNKLNNLKQEGGTLVVTAPLGYNPNLDNMLKEKMLPFKEVHYLKRTSAAGTWIEFKPDFNEEFIYGRPYPCANTIFIGIN